MKKDVLMSKFQEIISLTVQSESPYIIRYYNAWEEDKKIFIVVSNNILFLKLVTIDPKKCINRRYFYLSHDKYLFLAPDGALPIFIETFSKLQEQNK